MLLTENLGSSTFSLDVIRALEFAHIGDDLFNVAWTDRADGWHISKSPMMRLNAELRCALEGYIAVVARLVNLMHERRATLRS